MPPKTERKKAGRKPVPIDEAQLCALAARQWPMVAVAGFFGVSVDTIERRFADKFWAAQARGRGKILDMAWSGAEAGDVKLISLLFNHYVEPAHKPTPPSVIINNNPTPQTDATLAEIREILEAQECSRQTKPLSLVRSGGLLSL